MLLFVRGITLLNTMLSVGVFLGISLTVFLLAKQSQKSYANIFLALVVLCYTIFILPGYLYGARILQYVPHISNTGALIYPLLGPLIYLYAKASTQRSFRLQLRDFLHVTPFLFFLIIDWDFLVISGPEKYAHYENLIIRGVYPMPVWERLAKVLVSSVYFLLSIRFIFRYQKHLSATSTSIDRTYSQWLLLFSSVLLVPLVIIALVAFTQYEVVSVTIFAFCFVFFIIVVYAAALLKPRLFHRFPNQMESESAQEIAQKKYESSNLRESQKEQMVNKLLTYVTTEKPYLEPELTLGQLAEQVDIPSHYLSQIINEKIQQSFGDFINSYRVEKAKAMLTDDNYSHFTIIATAYEAGFNSKTAFYEAFKKFTGSTPSKYRKSLISS
ncbi:helix-turn-helix domain-containing protein [Neolewinella agarilytica]|uniref:Helix-turn-helix domain-containing protein n=1 Tax=Neolewinella agarilytica TaxID=478744 RepID=A0A1H9C9D4_9BACT|nr:helix-turn-helix domain-containing protein [Neolewinella agarilytica]SEP97754.1 Helix-turn-helix domain-containing protein [Neolewinella agarilytica]